MRKKRKLRARAEAERQRRESGAVEATDDDAIDATADLVDPGAIGDDELDAAQADDGEQVEELDSTDDTEETVTADPEAELEPYTLDAERLKSVIESLLFASDKPMAMAQLKQLTGVRDAAAIQQALDQLVEDYLDRGIILTDVAGGYQFRTHPSNSEYVQRLVAGRPVRLSRAQLETLAIVAYRQPVTRPEIDEIRGVDCGSTLKVLVDRHLIRVLGKKEEPGRPLLYGTSKDFLEFFNLNDLRDLPTLREFHELSEESLQKVEAHDRASSGDEQDASASADDSTDEARADSTASTEADLAEDATSAAADSVEQTEDEQADDESERTAQAGV